MIAGVGRWAARSEEASMKPTLAVIDIDIFSGHDELARECLLENLAKSRKAAVTPLWVNWLRERADLRVVCLIHDLEQLDDFLVDVIRTIPGVRGTSAQLAFDGTMRGESLLDVSLLNSGWDRRAAATVMIKSQPGQDREVYQALLELPHHEEVEVVWVVKLFHSIDADLLVLLLGERTSALTGYVMSWIRTVPGVMDTQLSSVLDWRIVGQTEDFIALAQRFPEPLPAGK
jgi:DNA-binding Lrp family transcriptional regulator